MYTNISSVLLPQQLPIGISNEKIYDFFCIISNYTGIPPNLIYANSTQCAYGGQPLLLDVFTIANIDDTWRKLMLNPKDNAVGVGNYAEYWLLSINRKYTKLHNILLIQLLPGEMIETIREIIALGVRSLRQSGGIVLYDNILHDYWKVFRPVEIRNNLLHVSHISENELIESKARLDASLIPYRRYNTPLIRRNPGEFNAISDIDRVKCKWMALEIINGSRMLLGMEKLKETELIVDKRGILRIPMSIPEEENAFASIWLKIDVLWDNIDKIIPYTPNNNEITEIVTQIAPYPTFEQTSNNIIPIEGEIETVIENKRRDTITIDGNKYTIVIND